jgi:hypothetical protein
MYLHVQVLLLGLAARLARARQSKSSSLEAGWLTSLARAVRHRLDAGEPACVAPTATSTPIASASTASTAAASPAAAAASAAATSVPAATAASVAATSVPAAAASANPSAAAAAIAAAAVAASCQLQRDGTLLPDQQRLYFAADFHNSGRFEQLYAALRDTVPLKGTLKAAMKQQALLNVRDTPSALHLLTMPAPPSLELAERHRELYARRWPEAARALWAAEPLTPAGGGGGGLAKKRLQGGGEGGGTAAAESAMIGAAGASGSGTVKRQATLSFASPTAVSAAAAPAPVAVAAPVAAAASSAVVSLETAEDVLAPGFCLRCGCSRSLSDLGCRRCETVHCEK